MLAHHLCLSTEALSSGDGNYAFGVERRAMPVCGISFEKVDVTIRSKMMKVPAVRNSFGVVQRSIDVRFSLILGQLFRLLI